LRMRCHRQRQEGEKHRRYQKPGLHMSLQRLGFPTASGWTQHQAPGFVFRSLWRNYLSSELTNCGGAGCRAHLAGPAAARGNLFCISSIGVRADPKEARQMWLYVVTWLPLLSISLTAAICFGVASFIVGQAKPRTGPF
jgi:hypothetical protein